MMFGIRLVSFDPLHASTVAGWVRTRNDLRWLAPSTAPPLTAGKVLGWLRPGGQAFSLVEGADALPAGYGELNPMRSDANHLWLGHIIVRPDLRGQGLGRAFVRSMMEHAFDQLGTNRISLIVFPDNATAVACYLGIGFKLVGEERHQFGGCGPEEPMLRMEISPPLPHENATSEDSCAKHGRTCSR